jgi:hypothetical protein
MRRLITLAVVALAAAGALAVHATQSEAKWHILSETAINTNKLCSDGLRFTWASGETATQPPSTRPTGQPRFVGPVDLFVQHAAANTPDDDQDWFNTPMAGAATFTAVYAPVHNLTADVWYPYRYIGTIAFRHPLTPTTEAVRLDTQPNGDSDAATAVEPVGTCVLFGKFDFLPGVSPNTVDFSQDGTLGAAILSTTSFDATAVRPGSVFLGETGAEAAPLSFAKVDANGDGRTDLTLQFRRSETGIACTDTEVLLSAIDPATGVRFYKSDSIQTLNC